MCAFGQKWGFIMLMLSGLLCSGAMPGVVRADDKDGDTPPAKTETTKPSAAKVDVTAPLTDRERMLLDRIEQLEKRMAVLEAEGQPAFPSSNESLASQPSAVAPAQAGAENSAAGGGVTTAVPVATASAAPQEKASTAPAKAEPFAFADFTWLTGNARTNGSPMDTKFFTPEIGADGDYVYDLIHPKDNAISGTSEIFRANEVLASP